MYVLISHAMGGERGERGEEKEDGGKRKGRGQEGKGEVKWEKKGEGSRKEEKEVRMKCDDGGSEGKERGEDFEEVREGSKHVFTDPMLPPVFFRPLPTTCTLPTRRTTMNCCSSF